MKSYVIRRRKIEVWGVCSFLWGLVGQREGERDICGTAIVYQH